MQALQLIKDLALRDYYHSNQQRTNLEIQLKELLRNPLHEKHGKARHYKKVLIKHQTNILYFLHHPKVPPDDKGSEKAIRNIKVKQKYPGNLNQTKALMALLS